MIITVGKLRSLIVESLLTERAMTTSDAEGLALMIQEMANGFELTLYDGTAIKEELENRTYDVTFLKDHIVATLGAKKRSDGYDQIDHTAAEKGWGPFIYDIALSLSSEGIMPDRTYVSPSAKHVWDKYQERTDVEKIPLKGKTGIRLHNQSALDFAYKLKGPGPNTQELQKFHQELDNMTDGEMSMDLREAAPKFFHAKDGG